MRAFLLLAILLVPLAAGEAAANPNGPGLKANLPVRGHKSLVWEAIVPRDYKADRAWPAVLLLRRQTAITDWQGWADEQGVLVLSYSTPQTEPPSTKPASGKDLDDILATITGEAGKRWNVHPALRVAVGLGGSEAGAALWRTPASKWAQGLVSLLGTALPAGETLPPAWTPVFATWGAFAQAPAQEVAFEDGANRLRLNGNPLHTRQIKTEHARADLKQAEAVEAVEWAFGMLRLGHPQLAGDKKGFEEELAKRAAAIAALKGDAEKAAACEELLAIPGLDKRPAAAEVVKTWQDAAWAVAAASATSSALRYHALADLLAQPRAAAAPWAKEAKAELATLQKDESIRKDVQARRAYEAMAAEEAAAKENVGKLKKLSKGFEDLAAAFPNARHGQLALKAVSRIEAKLAALENPGKKK